MRDPGIPTSFEFRPASDGGLSNRGAQRQLRAGSRTPEPGPDHRLQNPRESEQLVALRRGVLKCTQEDARGEPGDTDPVTAVAERKEVTREVPVRTDVRQAVDGVLLLEVPRPLRSRSGNRRV